jgi:hypothetical protein
MLAASWPAYGGEALVRFQQCRGATPHAARRAHPVHKPGASKNWELDQHAS